MNRTVALEEAAIARRERLGAVEAGIPEGWRLDIHRRCLSLWLRPVRARRVGEIMGPAIPQINRSIIMHYMKEIDHLALDGHALELFLAVLEEGSVTSAATRLGLTQSAVSHGLNKLRRIAGDPLF